MTEQTTKMAVLQERQIVMASDINEIKADLKEIKKLLGVNVVTVKDFEEHKNEFRKEMDDLQRRLNSRALYILITTSAITGMIAFIFHQLTER